MLLEGGDTAHIAYTNDNLAYDVAGSNFSNIILPEEMSTDDSREVINETKVGIIYIWSFLLQVYL